MASGALSADRERAAGERDGVLSPPAPGLTREENGLLNKESFVPPLPWLLTGPEDLQVSAPAKKGGVMGGSGLAGSTHWCPGRHPSP